jgi:undecaprenyl-diphosphatase
MEPQSVDALHVAALAIVQGLTEFLPISSSAHLVLLPMLTGWSDQGLAFDVAAHLGSLLAIVAYFRHDLRVISAAWWRSVVLRRLNTDASLAWAVLFATVPAGLAGLLFKGVVETHLRSPLVIATTTVVFGLLLWVADRRARQSRQERELGWRDVVVIGCMQALALIPGTSRSGITMTAGLLLGLTRSAAARFSFLLAIPVIALSGAKTSYDLVQTAESVEWSMLALGALLSAAAAYLCIHWFLRWLERMGFTPFVLYRLLLGRVLFAIFL